MAKTNRTGDLVLQLRKKFLESYEKFKDDDVYDDDDLKLIQDDWYLKRFLLATYRNLDDAFKMLDETMRWRNDMYISQVRDFHFPSELYKIGGLFIYEPDKQGTMVLYMRIRMHRKTVELEEPEKGFVVHTFNKAEKLSKGQGFAIVFDLTGAGYSNLDLPFLSFLIQFGRNHFPGSLSYILVYNLPWILSSFQKVAFKMLPEGATNLIKFASGKEIFDYIDPENVPDYIEGGRCRRNFRAVAPGSRPILDVMTHYGYSRDVYDRVYPMFQKDLEEAARALQEKEYEDPPPGFFDEINCEWAPLPLPSRRVREPKKKRTIPVEDSRELSKKLKQPSEDLLSVFPSDIASFVFDGKSYVADIDLKNWTDQLVAYKILSTNPRNYTVSPFKGILLPKSALRVTVTFMGKSASSPIPSSKDKFLIVSTVVTSQNMSAQDFAKLWKSPSEISSYKLRSRIAFTSAEETFDSLDSSISNVSFTSTASKGSLSEQLVRMDYKFRRLDAKYTRLLIAFYALLLLTIVLWVLIIAHFNGCDILSSIATFANPRTKGILNTVCKMSGLKERK